MENGRLVPWNESCAIVHRCQIDRRLRLIEIFSDTRIQQSARIRFIGTTGKDDDTGIDEEKVGE